MMMKINNKRGLIIMVIAYIRPDKNFVAVGEQLQQIKSYAIAKNLVIDDEFVDYISQDKLLRERVHVTDYFQSHTKSILIIYDVWVLSTNVQDLVQMFSCLLKHEFIVHFIKQSVIISKQSNVMLVLGLIDHFRQTLQGESKRVIGRPKGSKSNSKFDQYISDILTYLRERKSVSEISRLLGISRSSLKDYIESRELKQVAFGSLLPESPEDAEDQVINKIVCTNENSGEN
jgi:DNA invertase Pin-like site-specific DNA recombinase